MKTTKHPIRYPFREIYPNVQEVIGFEGGMVYKSIQDNKFVVIVDSGTMADFLDEDDLDLLDQLVTVMEFDSETELTQYLEVHIARFKKPFR